MVNDVLVPEKIDFVIETMRPVRRKIDTHKGSDVKPKIRFDLGDGKLLTQPRIGNQNHNQTKRVFKNICQSRAQTRNGIHKHIGLFARRIAINQFRQHEHHKGRYGNQQGIGIRFHTCECMNFNELEKVCVEIH